MVISFKVFEVVEPRDVGLIASKLKGLRLVEEEEIDGRLVETGLVVRDLELSEGGLKGTIEESFVISVRYRDEYIRVPVTVESPFEFYEWRERLFLIIEAKKTRANRLAGFISQVIAARKNAVVEAYLPHEALKALHEENPGGTRVIFFDEVKVPGVKKLSLYGEQLADTELYQEYLRLGRIWYVVFETQGGIVVGVTRNCVVTVFSRVDPEDALAVVKEVIIPRTQPPPVE